MNYFFLSFLTIVSFASVVASIATLNDMAKGIKYSKLEFWFFVLPGLNVLTFAVMFWKFIFSGFFEYVRSVRDNYKNNTK